MTEYPFKWYVSNDEEVWHNECGTREEALQYACAEGWRLIGQCRPQDFDMEVSGGVILEALESNNEERANEDGEVIDADPDQILDLGAMVSAAISAWVEKHKINTRAWALAEVWDVERVVVAA